jgi:hypothetical protein
MASTAIATPNNTDLNATYSPTAAELTAGFVKLVLTSTGNGNCNQIGDTVRINYTNPPTANPLPCGVVFSDIIINL